MQHPGHPEEVPKEFHPQGLDYKSDISCTDILISEREMFRYESEWHYRQNRINSIFHLVKW